MRALCDRRAGIGGDGVLRVVVPTEGSVAVATPGFMDYRNADGSLAEMCGNGIRLFASYLADEGLSTRPDRSAVGTRDGASARRRR